VDLARRHDETHSLRALADPALLVLMALALEGRIALVQRGELHLERPNTKHVVSQRNCGLHHTCRARPELVI
jgi:hypothetical protein